MGGGGAKKGYFLISKGKGKIQEKVVFFINNLPQTGKMFLHWFDGNQFLKLPTKGMSFKVSCGGCNKYCEGSGYKSILQEIEAVINDICTGVGCGLRAFAAYTVDDIVLPV